MDDDFTASQPIQANDSLIMGDDFTIRCQSAWLKPLQSVYRGPAEAEIVQRRSLEFPNATWRYYDVGL
ncbi:hypothetical protein H0H93_009114 [Arthromyces matolae]|nr:hypothetical protein H0H93_009114 [Arthromyces matolae]